MKQIHSFLICLLSFISLPIWADWTQENVTMKVGEEKTLYLPSSVTSKNLKSTPQFYSASISYVEIVSKSYSSVKVRAKKATSTPVIVRCDYYYNVLRDGKWVYGGSGAYDFLITITDVKVKQITLNHSSVSLDKGETVQLTATVKPDNASDKSVSWKSDNTNVATINSNGLVTAKGEGTAIITCTANDGSGKSATCTVTVKSSIILVTSITLNSYSESMSVGDKKQLIETIKPSNATNKSVSWSTSKSSVATVSSSGLVTAKGEGSATITCKANDGSGKSATCSVTVSPSNVLVSSITLNSSSESMSVGDSKQLTATIKPDNATNKSVSWSTSKSSVATVSSSGLVTAKGEGSATITCKANDGSGKSATCSITVTPSNILVSSITLNSSSESMSVGDSKQLTATIKPDNATNKNVSWSSNNTNVATVSSSGLVTAKGEGSATITCKAKDGSGKYATCSVTVTSSKVLITSITLNSNSESMSVGNTKQLTATVKPDNATDKSVSWSSNNTNVATVSSSGLVTAMGEGSATITCKAKDGSGISANCFVTVKKEETEPDVQLKEVICFTENLQDLSSRDKLWFEWVLVNYGHEVVVRSKIAIIDKSNMKILYQSDEVEETLKSNGSILHLDKISLVNVPNGNYYATVIYSVDWGEKRWHYKDNTSLYEISKKYSVVTEILLNSKSETLYVGDTKQLTATIKPDDAEDKSVSWSSNNTSVATVSNSGLVTAIGEGTATITCTANEGSGVSASCSIVVKATDSEPDVHFLKVQCLNTNLSNLTHEDMLHFKGSFVNYGGNTQIKIVLALLNKNTRNILGSGPKYIVALRKNQTYEGDFYCSLKSISNGEYYATLLFYQDWGNEEDQGWYYFNNDSLYEITITDGTGILDLENSKYNLEKDKIIYDLNGKRLSNLHKGINIIGGKKILVK